jgi:hypothetical protein
MDSSEIATESEYYRCGVLLNILTEQQVKNWAFNLIDLLDEPMYELIEIAGMQGINPILSELASIKGERQTQKVGLWLLAKLGELFTSGVLSPKETIKKGMDLVTMTNMDKELYYFFDYVEDGFYLAEYVHIGTVEEYVEELKLKLAGYAPYKVQDF